MAKNFLKIVNVSAVHHEVRSECAPKIVKAKNFINLGFLQKDSEFSVQMIYIKRVVILIHKDIICLGSLFESQEVILHYGVNWNESSALNRLGSVSKTISISQSTDFHQTCIEINLVPAKSGLLILHSKSFLLIRI